MKRKYLVAIGVGLTGLVLDQIVKTIVEYNMSVGHKYDVLTGFIELKYAQNTGMAFGLLQDLPSAWQRPFFTAITFVAVGIIIHLLRQAPERVLRFPIALGFIMSGAFGNLTDRYRWSYVVDFIHVYYWPPRHYDWPIFNLADTFISIGIGLLILDTIFTKDDAAAAAEAMPPGDVAGEEGVAAPEESPPAPDESLAAAPEALPARPGDDAP